MPQTDYAGFAVPTQLVGTLPSGAGPGTVIQLLNGTGYPTGALGINFVLTLDKNTGTEEKILCSLRSGNNVTIAQRGYDDTSPATHTNGTVSHTADATVLRTSSAHIYDATRDDHTQYLRADGTRTAPFIKLSGVGGVPRVYWKATDQAVDNKVWDAVVIGTQLVFRAINDAENVGQSWLTVQRAGVGTGFASTLTGTFTLLDTAGNPSIVLNPTAGGVTPHGEITTQGDQSGLRGLNGAGTRRYLFGLRSDVVGNPNDVVLYVDGGGLVIYPSAGGTLTWQVRSDGTVRSSTGGGAVNLIGHEIYHSPNSGYSGLYIHSNWGDGGPSGPMIRVANANGDIFQIDLYGRICFPRASANGPIVTATASAGTSGAPPAQVVGYLMVQIDGTTRKLPYYAV